MAIFHNNDKKKETISEKMEHIKSIKELDYVSMASYYMAEEWTISGDLKAALVASNWYIAHEIRLLRMAILEMLKKE